MQDFKLTCLWLLSSLGNRALSQPDGQLQSLHRENLALTPVSLRSIPELQKRCTGDCVTCFGQGYQECASDSSVCYKPGDPVHGEESCSGTSFNVPSVPTFDFCNDGSCATCFGEGFQNCPDSTVSCYKPGDATYGLESACSSSSDASSDTGSSSSPSSAAATAESSSQPTSSPSSSDGYNITSTDFCNNGGFDCKRCFGSTYIPCPESSAYASQSYCYDPNNSTSICPDGTQPAPGTGSGTGSTGSGSGSSSDDASSSSSASYTASAASETSNTATQVTASGSASETTPVVGGSIGSGSGVSSSDEDASDTSSTFFSSSRTSSATSGVQTSSASGDSNGEPISASSSGQSSVREGLFGVLVVSGMCLGVSAWSHF